MIKRETKNNTLRRRRDHELGGTTPARYLEKGRRALKENRAEYKDDSEERAGSQPEKSRPVDGSGGGFGRGGGVQRRENLRSGPSQRVTVSHDKGKSGKGPKRVADPPKKRRETRLSWTHRIKKEL